MLPKYSENTATSETEFSMSNALAHLKEITKEPHFVGSEEHKVVQNYIVNELKKLGLEPEIQTETVINNKWHAATKTQNIIATIKGSDSKKSLLLLSHYDSSPHSSFGASDAGSGVVTILEGVRAFLANNTQPKNDVIILISDAEELGLLGAKAFVDAHPLAKNVGLVLNFEARGSGGPSYMLMETNGKNSKLLAEFINANPTYPIANSLMYSVYKMLPNDTDLTVFRENANINGFNFAFIGDHFDYHTALDTYERLDRETLLHQADYLSTLLPYFANSDLTNLESDNDLVYTNFPFTKLLHYPFSWSTPLLILAVLILLIVLFFGISLNKITIKGMLKGLIPFGLSLVVCVGLSFILWKGILLIHPQYNDILHGFTYNGYYYIAAFVCLNLWILFKIYKPHFKKQSGVDLVIIPIVFWLIINTFIVIYLKGAGYFILPVLFALVGIAIHVFFKISKTTTIFLFTLLSIPVLYMFAPQIKMFPVGLGLKNLFISSVFIVIIFGLTVPVFASYKSRKLLSKALGLATLVFFGYTSFTSGFNAENKKPNSLVFIQNNDTNTAYFATHNKTIDSYTEQIFGKNPTRGTIENTEKRNKYKTQFNYVKEMEPKLIPSSNIEIIKDTIIEDERIVNFNVKPQRKLNFIELINDEKVTFHQLKVDGAIAKNNGTFAVKKKPFLAYYLQENDSLISVSIKVKKDEKLQINIHETSFDLLTNPLFSLQPRTNEMIPMPSVTNDAIITIKKISL